jgi:hypothetical protein
MTELKKTEDSMFAFADFLLQCFIMWSNFPCATH